MDAPSGSPTVLVTWAVFVVSTLGGRHDVDLPVEAQLVHRQRVLVLGL